LGGFKLGYQLIKDNQTFFEFLRWVGILDVAEHEPRAFAFCVEPDEPAVVELCVVEQSECPCGKSKAERPVWLIEDVENVGGVRTITDWVVSYHEDSDFDVMVLAQAVNGFIDAFAVSDVNSQAVAESLF